MTKKTVRLFIRLVLLTILFAAIHALSLLKVLPEIYLKAQPWLIYYFLVPIEVLGVLFIAKRFHVKKTSVMNNFMFLMMVKMLGAILFLYPWIYQKDEFTRPFIYQFFIVFFLFLIAEVTFIVRLLAQSDEKNENFE